MIAGRFWRAFRSTQDNIGNISHIVLNTEVMASSGGAAPSPNGAPLPRRHYLPPKSSRNRGPTGGGSDDSQGLRPHKSSELGYLKFQFLILFPNTGDFKGSGASPCRMVRVGESRQSFPLPVTGFGALPELAGRSRAEPHRRA